MKVNDAYEVISQDYDAHRNRSPYFKIIEGLTQRCFLENTQGKSFENGLDIGCGTGRNIPLYLEKCNRVQAVDYTPGMLKYAKEKFGREQPVDLMLGDVRHLPFRDNMFDMVGCFKVLPHVQNVDRAVLEIARVAKKNGRIFLEFYSPYSFRRLLSRFKHYTEWHTVDQACKLISASGLKVHKVYGLRTFMATECLCYLPGGYSLFSYLENRFTNTIFNQFSGYYVIVCEK